MADDETNEYDPVLVARHEPVALDEAIVLIEAGKASAAIRVDVGGGRLARADGRNGLPGLLQRLRGHRLLLSMRDAERALPEIGETQPQLVEQARILLDAVRALD